MSGRMKIFVVASLLPVLMLYATPCGAVGFGSAQTYTVGTNPSGVVVADFNSDGKMDIAVANAGSGNVSVLLGKGDGTFHATVNFDAGMAGPSSIYAGDFNHDGKPDLAVFTPGDFQNAAGVVSILLGNGDGTFAAPRILTLTPHSSRLIVADFNGDKRDDLAVSEFDSQAKTTTLDIFLGKGDGTFQAALQTAVSTLQNVPFFSADFNGDGEADLVCGTASGMLILLGKGDGAFEQGSKVFFPDIGPPEFVLRSVVADDLNHDGKADLLASASTTFCSRRVDGICVQTTTRFSISSFLGNGDGSFQSGQVVAESLLNFIPLTGDFNGDGTEDVEYGVVSLIRLGRGDGTFSPAAANAGKSPSAVADLNGDNCADLIVVDHANNQIEVILNTSQTIGADVGIAGPAANPDPAGVGLNLTYTADVLNEGPNGATGVTFTDMLPGGVTFVSATATQGICAQTNGTVTCNIGALSSALDAQVTIIVSPTVAGSITNSMHVAATQTDLDAANDASSQTVTVVPTHKLTVTDAGNGAGTVSDDSGLNCGLTCTQLLPSGAQINLDATPHAGSLFTSWGGACSGSAVPCSITMDGDKSVTANFVLGVTLNVTVPGGGTGTVTSQDNSINCSDSGGTCSAIYLPGTSVSLHAAATNGAKFNQWSGACIGIDPSLCSVTLNSNQAVAAAILPPLDFSMSALAMSLTAAPGQTITDAISFAGQGGFSGGVQLSCGVIGPAPQPTCSMLPANIPAGANGPTSTLSIKVPAGSAALFPPEIDMRGRLAYSLAVPIVLLALGGICSRQRRKAWVLTGSLATLSFVLCCCGGGSSQPQSKSYSVAVTAKAGTVTKNVNIPLTVD